MVVLRAFELLFEHIYIYLYTDRNRETVERWGNVRTQQNTINEKNQQDLMPHIYNLFRLGIKQFWLHSYLSVSFETFSCNVLFIHPKPISAYIPIIHAQSVYKVHIFAFVQSMPTCFITNWPNGTYALLVWWNIYHHFHLLWVLSSPAVNTHLPQYSHTMEIVSRI